MFYIFMYTDSYTHTHTQSTCTPPYITRYFTKTLPAIVLLGLQFLSLFLPVRLSISAFVLFPLSNYRVVLERKKKKS